MSKSCQYLTPPIMTSLYTNTHSLTISAAAPLFTCISYTKPKIFTPLRGCNRLNIPRSIAGVFRIGSCGYEIDRSTPSAFRPRKTDGLWYNTESGDSVWVGGWCYELGLRRGVDVRAAKTYSDKDRFHIGGAPLDVADFIVYSFI